MRFCVLVLLTTTVFSSNPLTDSDCEVCMQFVRSSDATKIRDAACRVVQARGEVVDADWKLHSAAMISRDSDNRLLKEIENLVSKNINAELICGYMGVTSHKGGCTCPMSLESFENLKRIIDKVRDSSGSGSTPTDVISALNCPEDSSTTTSLLELGRRTKARRKRKTSSKALLMVTDTDCTSSREKGDKDKTASGIVEQVKPNSGAFKAKANTATSLVIGAVNVGIGLACPPCGVAFAAIWGFFNFLGNQFGEDFERRICQDIIEKGHTALSKKVPLADGTQMCVWDRLRNSGNFEHYIQGVNDIGGETLDVVQISQEENARVPDPLASSEVKSLMNFLVNVVPKPGVGSALHLTGKALVVSKIGDMMTEQLFRDATAQLFSDVRVYRTTTVLYLLQLFYAEAVIRKEDGEEITVAEDYDDTNWLNMDVFGHYLRDKLVSKLNSERGKPGLLNVDICLGGVRPGKISGCNDEYEKLLTAFNDAQAGFIEYYLSGLSGRGTGSGGGFRGSGGDGGRGGAGKSPF